MEGGINTSSTVDKLMACSCAAVNDVQQSYRVISSFEFEIPEDLRDPPLEIPPSGEAPRRRPHAVSQEL